MANVNITKVYLLNVPLESDYKNTLYFTNASAQQSYFQSRIVRSYSDFSYQRKDHIIRIPAEYDDIYNVNYVMYQNAAYNNKWFYAFVKNLHYVNDGMTEATIETDVIQTWMFNYTVKSSFVEREHVDDDTIGIHTVPEQIEHGEYIVDQRVPGRSFSQVNTFIVGATIDLASEDFDDLTGCQVGGIYNGLRYFMFRDPNTLNIILANAAKAGRSDGIVSIFMGCSDFFDYESASESANIYKVTDSLTVTAKTWTLASLGGESIVPPTKPTSLNGYTPVNKKLLTYPYCYLMASNNAGANAIYKYELFSNNQCDFRFIGTLTPGMSIRLQPLDYNNQAINNEEGLNLGKLPTCSWNTDVYTNWLTQNAVNIGLNVANAGSQLIGGVGLMAAGGVVGNVWGAQEFYHGVQNIIGTMGEIYQHSLTPPQAEGNINNGDVSFSAGLCRADLYKMSIKAEYAKIIDKYFDMFGYKVNMVKVPNKAHRAKYWYTKTIDVSIDGSLPQEDLQKIKDCYNSGIRFWRNASEIEDYSVSNGIV